jgi:hypothetical protein
VRDEQTHLAHLYDPKAPLLNVEASLALSYDALAAETQQAFAQPGVFLGSFTYEAAEAVIAVDGSDTADLLDDLYLSSLLEFDEQAAEIVENLEAALEQFRSVGTELESEAER